MKTYTANPLDQDDVCRALLEQYRDQNATPIYGCTVELEDQGQDFLEFDIQQGVIVATRPFQGFVWNGRKVGNEEIHPGDTLSLDNGEGGFVRLRYPVIGIRAIES